MATLGEKKGKSKGKSLGFEIPESDKEEIVDVVFFNDDITTVDFVIRVLMTVFFLPKEKADPSESAVVQNPLFLRP